MKSVCSPVDILLNHSFKACNFEIVEIKVLKKVYFKKICDKEHQSDE